MLLFLRHYQKFFIGCILFFFLLSLSFVGVQSLWNRSNKSIDEVVLVNKKRWQSTDTEECMKFLQWQHSEAHNEKKLSWIAAMTQEGWFPIFTDWAWPVMAKEQEELWKNEKEWVPYRHPSIQALNLENQWRMGQVNLYDLWVNVHQQTSPKKRFLAKMDLWFHQLPFPSDLVRQFFMQNQSGLPIEKQDPKLAFATFNPLGFQSGPQSFFLALGPESARAFILFLAQVHAKAQKSGTLLPEPIARAAYDHWNVKRNPSTLAQYQITPTRARELGVFFLQVHAYLNRFQHALTPHNGSAPWIRWVSRSLKVEKVSLPAIWSPDSLEQLAIMSLYLEHVKGQSNLFKVQWGPHDPSISERLMQRAPWLLMQEIDISYSSDVLETHRQEISWHRAWKWITKNASFADIQQVLSEANQQDWLEPQQRHVAFLKLSAQQQDALLRFAKTALVRKPEEIKARLDNQTPKRLRLKLPLGALACHDLAGITDGGALWRHLQQKDSKGVYTQDNENFYLFHRVTIRGMPQVMPVKNILHSPQGNAVLEEFLRRDHEDLLAHRQEIPQKFQEARAVLLRKRCHDTLGMLHRLATYHKLAIPPFNEDNLDELLPWIPSVWVLQKVTEGVLPGFQEQVDEGDLEQQWLLQRQLIEKKFSILHREQRQFWFEKVARNANWTVVTPKEGEEDAGSVVRPIKITPAAHVITQPRSPLTDYLLEQSLKPFLGEIPLN